MSRSTSHADKVVIVVDDDPRLVALVRDVLRGLGVGLALGFTDPDGAFAAMTARHIDAAVIDLTLPHTDGLALSRRIRRSDRVVNAVMPIVLTTARADMATLRRAVRQGVDEVLVRPFSPNGLRQRISAALERPRTYVRTPTGYFGPDRRATGGAAPGWMAGAEVVTRDHLIERRRQARDKYGRLPPSPLEPKSLGAVLVGPVTTIPVVAAAPGGPALVRVPTSLRGRPNAGPAMRDPAGSPAGAAAGSLPAKPRFHRKAPDDLPADAPRLWREDAPGEEVHLLD